MSKKTRSIIFLICAVLFFIIIPYILLYSLGYRIDFEERKIVATGGLYIRAIPQGADIIIDSKISNKTGLFSNSVFVQNLLPKQHTILIKKEGYYDYQKNLNVKENEVTKLENVILFKKNIAFEIVTDKTQSPFNQQIIQDKYLIKNHNLYYSDIQKNNVLDQSQKNAPILKNITAYKISNGNIIWLGLDGFLYSSDFNGKNTEKLSLINLTISKEGSYKILVFGQNIFLKNNDYMLLFDRSIKSFQNFYNPVIDLKISPDGEKVTYFNDHEILSSFLNSNNPDKIFLNRFSETISDCYWLDNNYVIFRLGDDKIIISEIDIRGNINTINLPQNTTLADGKKVVFKNPQIIFNQQDKKLYILNQNNLLVSEKLIP